MNETDITTLMEGATDEVTTNTVAEAAKSHGGLFALGGLLIGAGAMFIVDRFLFKKQLIKWEEEILEGIPMPDMDDNKTKKEATDDGKDDTDNDNN